MLNLAQIQDPYKGRPTPSMDAIAARLADHRGRSAAGKFTWQGTLSVMADDDFPPDSVYWRRYGRGNLIALCNKLDDLYQPTINLIFPGETIQEFTWRTITEVVEAAIKVVDAGERDPQTIAAAAHAELEKLIKEYKQ